MTEIAATAAGCQAAEVAEIFLADGRGIEAVTGTDVHEPNYLPEALADDDDYETLCYGIQAGGPEPDPSFEPFGDGPEPAPSFEPSGDETEPEESVTGPVFPTGRERSGLSEEPEAAECQSLPDVLWVQAP
eukprot:s1849_g11.t2